MVVRCGSLSCSPDTLGMVELFNKHSFRGAKISIAGIDGGIYKNADCDTMMTVMLMLIVMIRVKFMVLTQKDYKM